MSNQLNLIFDGNYLFYKSMHVINRYSSNKSQKFLSNTEEINILVRKVATDFVSVLKKFPGYHKVIFTKDSRSWRKEFFSDYKGNRLKDSNIDWDNMFRAMDDFLEIIKKRGVIVLSQQGAEGDDLIYLWTKVNNFQKNKKVNNIVITGDSDLSQIVDFNNDSFTIIYNNNSKQRRFIVKKGFQNWINNYKESDLNINDIFSNRLDEIFNVSNIDLILAAMNNIEVIEIDPNEVALYKAICGDDGDNIPSIYSWFIKTPKGERIKRITKVYFNKLYNEIIQRFDKINMYDLMTNHAFRNFVRIALQNIAKIKIPQDEWEKNLDRNITLSFLDKSTIPQNIQDDFLRINKNTNDINTDSFNRIDLLEGTRFAKYQNDASVFETLDKIADQ